MNMQRIIRKRKQAHFHFETRPRFKYRGPLLIWFEQVMV